MKEKILKKIDFWKFSEIPYGSKDAQIKEVFKIVGFVIFAVAILCRGIVVEKNIIIDALFTYCIFVLVTLLFVSIAHHVYISRKNSNKRQKIKKFFFAFIMIVFSVGILPYTGMFILLRKSNKKYIFDFFHVFIFELLITTIIIMAVAKTWDGQVAENIVAQNVRLESITIEKSVDGCELEEELVAEKITADNMKILDNKNSYKSMLVTCFVFIGGYKFVRMLYRRITIWQNYKRCEYIIEYTLISNFVCTIAAVILSLLSGEFSGITIAMTVYILFETITYEIRTRKRQYNLVLQLFSETIFLLDEIIPSIKSYKEIKIRVKLSSSQKELDNYIKLYKYWDNSSKSLQVVLGEYNKLLNKKYDCTEQENVEKLLSDIKSVLNVAAGYLLGFRCSKCLRKYSIQL